MGAYRSWWSGGAVAVVGRVGDWRVLVAATLLGFLTGFGFVTLPRTGRAFGRDRLTALREPVERAFFRRLMRSAMSR
jgi:hypothetical protein